MSLINCKACNQQVSKNAFICPHCGEQLRQQKKKTGLFTWLIAITIVPGIFIAIYQGATQPPPPPKTAEQLHKDKIEQAFSAWDGSHIELESYIKSNLKDPGSYEHIKTNYVDKGDHVIVHTQYRARNSFGGMVTGAIIARAEYDGTLKEIISSSE